MYIHNDDILIMIATDKFLHLTMFYQRHSLQGQVLNQIATKFLKDTEDIVQNWMIDPNPSVTVGKKCNPFKVEMVIRGYLTGHAERIQIWKKIMWCSNADGMKENQKFTNPIITPTTKQGWTWQDLSKKKYYLQDL